MSTQRKEMSSIARSIPSTGSAIALLVRISATTPLAASWLLQKWIPYGGRVLF
jgi:hypothetical protein